MVDDVVSLVVATGAVTYEEIIAVGQDGWHYSLAELSSMNDPVGMRARRVNLSTSWS